MDQILNQATSTEFWVNVLVGQALFVGGIIWLIVSTRSSFQQASQEEAKKNLKRGPSF